MEYEKNCFRYVDKVDYVVNDNFPKLTRDNVASEIVAGEYTLSLVAIEKFRRSSVKESKLNQKRGLDTKRRFT